MAVRAEQGEPDSEQREADNHAIPPAPLDLNQVVQQLVEDQLREFREEAREAGHRQAEEGDPSARGDPSS